MKRAAVLLKGDIKNISRDPILAMSVIAPLLAAVGVRFLVPFASGLLLRELSFDLTIYNELIASTMLLVTPLMIGMLAGFIILDEKDENLLTYFAVTPLTKTGYLIYRMTFPIAAGFIMSFIMLEIMNLARLSFIALLPIMLMVSMEAPMAALLLGRFATNKVEGLALSKAIGIFLLAPIAGYFIKSNWQLLAGISPTYWVSKAFIAGINSQPSYWFYIAAGLVIHIIYIYMMFNSFESRQ